MLKLFDIRSYLQRKINSRRVFEIIFKKRKVSESTERERSKRRQRKHSRSKLTFKYI
jgi:hypothetical protein